jgi:HEAT repeat protein
MVQGSVDIPPEALKPRRFNPVMVVLGLVIVAVGGGLLWYGIRQSESKMSVEQRMEEQKNIFLLPAKDQIPRWAKWAADKTADVDLRCEALAQLGMLNAPEGLALAVAGLKEPNHKLRGTCAQVLAHYGKAKAGDDARAALLAALKEADDSDRPQILWALVELGEKSVFDQAMEAYKADKITHVQRLAGGNAFNPEKITGLVTLDEIAKRATDEHGAVRQLVANLLSQNADPKWTDTLIKLVQDSDIAVAGAAAPGLGKIADDRARGPLIEALKKANDDNRIKFLEALRDGIGGEGLVLALDTVATEPESKNWFQTKQLFDMMHILADPRVGDALVKWVETKKPAKHWETEAGIALAEVGDIRGAKYLGARMGVDNKDIYSREKFWEADRGGHMLDNDLARIVGARMLADLGAIHPDKAAQLKEWAEQPVIKWLTTPENIAPRHANGLRFLAVVRSEEILPRLRKWSFPDADFPAEGAQPPMPRAFEVAQSALRYIGWMKDDGSYQELLDQFDSKKDKKMDITYEGLEGAGLAMLGMALRAVAYGAANGLAQWGPKDDSKAEEKLQEFIEDKLWNEEARFQACAALAWVAKDETLLKVVEKIGKFAASAEPKEQLIGACYADTLSRRPIPTAVAMMVDLMRPELEVNVRYTLARAIGVTGLADAPDAEKKLFDMLQNPELRNPAALALVMGGSADTAARTIASFADKDLTLALNDLKDHYFLAYGYWSDQDLDRGNIYRWVRNAEAIVRVKIGDAPQEWARQRLQAQFTNLTIDNGPHSETRVVLRARLIKAAKEGDTAKKEGAIMTLKFMKEQGALMALRTEQGETGEMARRAFHELMNPSLAAAEALDHLQEKSAKKGD